ncbi:hypothetical protein EF808_07585 [archaeon]|nr:MAG: hypothetical protein EF808_07585 [archaeon]
MNRQKFMRGEEVVPYLEEQLKNYYFKKKYQRYEPQQRIVEALQGFERSIYVAVATAKRCPYCIATIPMIIRLYLLMDNPKIEMRIFDEQVFVELNVTDDDKMPQLLVYDEAFNEFFRIDGKEMKEDFENALETRLAHLGILS